MPKYSRISRSIPWLVATLALLAVGAGPDSIVADFDKAVARLKNRGSSIAGTAKPPRIGLEEFPLEKRSVHA
ncbi:hypothetical protein [Singulisphaera sp. PoT]|uniref:hypothetical protein n=1 Tax=Singulisphaera sp. PoT TaxID=3411797 RepID=UPI003BF5B083